MNLRVWFLPSAAAVATGSRASAQDQHLETGIAGIVVAFSSGQEVGTRLGAGAAVAFLVTRPRLPSLELEGMAISASSPSSAACLVGPCEFPRAQGQLFVLRGAFITPPTRGSIHLYAGMGAGAYFTVLEGRSSTSAGLDLAVGLRQPLGQVRLVLEARSVALLGQDAGMNFVSISVGLLF